MHRGYWPKSSVRHLSLRGEELPSVRRSREVGEMAKDYGQLTSEIAQEIERLAGLQLQVASAQQNLRKMLEERGAIESELGLGSVRRSPNGRMNRDESAQVRKFWKEHATTLGVVFRDSGPLPAKVRAAYANRNARAVAAKA